MILLDALQKLPLSQMFLATLAIGLTICFAIFLLSRLFVSLSVRLHGIEPENPLALRESIISAVSAMFALLLAFSAAGIWNDRLQAANTVEREAAALENVRVLAGGLLAMLVRTLSPLPAAVDPKWVTLGVVLGMTVGIVAGVYPASRASKLDPVVAPLEHAALRVPVAEHDPTRRGAVQLELVDRGPMRVAVHERMHACGTQGRGHGSRSHVHDLGRRGADVHATARAQLASEPTTRRERQVPHDEAQERIAQDAPQTLVTRVGRAEHVAVHQQHVLAVQVDDRAVVEQRAAALRRKAPADEKVAIAVDEVHRHAAVGEATQRRDDRAPGRFGVVVRSTLVTGSRPAKTANSVAELYNPSAQPAIPRLCGVGEIDPRIMRS